MWHEAGPLTSEPRGVEATEDGTTTLAGALKGPMAPEALKSPADGVAAFKTHADGEDAAGEAGHPRVALAC